MLMKLKSTHASHKFKTPVTVIDRRVTYPVALVLHLFLGDCAWIILLVQNIIIKIFRIVSLPGNLVKALRLVASPCFQRTNTQALAH